MKKWKEKLQLYFKRYSKNEDYEITWEESLEKVKKEHCMLLDVRSMQEYEEGHLDGAICIPHYELKTQAEKILTQKGKTIILYCQSGTRSKKAYQILKKMGYTNLYHIKDGIGRKNIMLKRTFKKI